MKRLLVYLRSLLRELADESAYTRYLRASGKTHSAAAWKAFSDGHYRRKYTNAKCC